VRPVCLPLWLESVKTWLLAAEQISRRLPFLESIHTLITTFSVDTPCNLNSLWRRQAFSIMARVSLCFRGSMKVTCGPDTRWKMSLASSKSFESRKHTKEIFQEGVKWDRSGICTHERVKHPQNTFFSCMPPLIPERKIKRIVCFVTSLRGQPHSLLPTIKDFLCRHPYLI